MSEDKVKSSLYDDEDILKKFVKFENQYFQQVTITRVEGDCPYGHSEGDSFRVTNCNSDGLCGAFYTQLHSSLLTFQYGGRLPWDKDPACFTGICPEMKVQVEVERKKKDNIKLLKTLVDFKDMTGKGFPAVDKYRAFIEILGVELRCAWGQKQGHRFEIDPFNTGKVCGFLYSKAYPYLNVLLSGASFPWAEEHEMISVCPDSYNQTSFRLVIEKRK